MDMVLALALTLTAADPALAGAPTSAPPPPLGMVVMQGHRTGETAARRTNRSSETRRSVNAQTASVQTVSAHPFPPPPMSVQGRAATGSYEIQREQVSRRSITRQRVHATARGTGRTVTLEPGFFAGGLTGGVEAPARSYRVYGHGVVILRGSYAPPSAGQAAAARGLPRG